MLFANLQCSYRNEHIKILPGALIFIPMHLTGARKKSLISNTVPADEIQYSTVECPTQIMLIIINVG